ncbi:MAG: NADPH-dependent glutamate synthase [Candidatus Izemoplasmatales bacterium]|nr:NADPH-dependent glutamate synthase [Candidatus Izemoplasmatales bacterium]
MNGSLKKTPMPVQDPRDRIHNFQEVALGYNEDHAKVEAERCLQCKTRPCVAGCPVGIQIPDFLAAIIRQDYLAAYRIISRDSLLPAVCGRVCPQETQCEALCVRGKKGEPVGIGYCERFVADWYFQHVSTENTLIQSNHRKVAVVGSGPAGLSCAYDLCLKGYDVEVYEALHLPGGVLAYGIPEFRLPKAIVKREIDRLEQLGVKIHKNVIVGKTLLIDDLFEEGVQAVFLGTGAGLPNFMQIPGEMLNGVYSANEYLTRVNLMKAADKRSATPIFLAKHVAVVGGGNVALDAARSAKRLGAETVTILYRRSMKELPARKEEVDHAVEEGILFRTLTNPIAITGDEKGFVKSVECVKMLLGTIDASGRPRPIPDPNSTHKIDADAVIIAVGTTPNPLIMQTSQLETNRWGCIVTRNDSGLTSRDFVYAGGDVVTGAATVILAMGAGRKAAEAIDKDLCPTQ